MKRWVQVACVGATSGLLVACAGSDTKVQTAWTPVNRLDEQPRAIAASEAVTFIATPVDGSLRTLLLRWSREAGLALDYRAGSDFTLTADVAAIRATSIHAALEALNAAYAEQSLQFRFENATIEVAPRQATDVALQPRRSNPRKRP